MKEKSYRIEKMKCAGCVNNIVSALEALNGLTNVETNLAEKKVSIQFDEQQVGRNQIEEKLKEIGYPVS
ncbi:heavy-metal-associated domain-containing protein [Enterococcus sp. LJL98]